MSHATPVLLPAVNSHARDRAAAAFLAGFASANTRRTYALGLRIWFAYLDSYGLDAFQVDRTAVDVWMRHLEGAGASAATRSLRLTTVRSWYDWLVEEQLLVKNPAGRVRGPRREERTQPALSRVQVGQLLEHAQGVGGARWAMVALGFVNGLRVAEYCAADVTDLGNDRWHRTLTITGKGSKVLDIPLPPVTAAAVDAAVAGRDIGPLLVTRHGTRLTRNRANTWLAGMCQAAGIPVVSPHALRRTAIQLLLADGVPLRTVQTFARHSSSTTTARYDERVRSHDEHPSYSMMRVIA
jgi:integrase/recombinase XerD